MIRVQCPKCERRYRTRMEAFGRTAVCSKCHQPFKIGESRPPFEWKSTDLAEDSWVGVEAPAEKVERKHCIMCDAPLRREIRCPECGANQVTGLVQRRKPKAEDHEWSVGNLLPLRTMLIIAVVGAIAVSTYLAIAFIAKSTVQTAQEMAEDSAVKEATAYLRNGGDEFNFAGSFGGKVTDKNLPRFVRRLSAGDAAIRHAAVLLIGCGNFTDLAPVVEWARESKDPQLVVAVLGAIGSKRLLELSEAKDEPTRKAAAQAMLLLCQLPTTPENVSSLSEPISRTQKVTRYNDLCRAWPEAVGPFKLTVQKTAAPFDAKIEQIGPMFYLTLSGKEFASNPSAKRQFSIPIEQYCAATGTAVSAGYVKDLMRGEVMLSSPTGVGWEGTIRLSMRRPLEGPLPGFLPVDAPPSDGALALPLRLDRAK